MHQSDGAFSGGKSWFSDHFGGNDRLIDSDWIKRKSLAKKELKDKESKEPREPVAARATKKTISKKKPAAAVPVTAGTAGRSGNARSGKIIKDK
jgi:hypothetical protein